MEVPFLPVPRFTRPSLRGWLIRYLIALILVVLISNSGIAGGYWYAERKLGRAQRQDVDLAESFGSAKNFLIIGSDSRAFVDDPEEAEMFGTPEAIAGQEADQVITGQRADAIMIVRVDAKKKRALLVSIPRDTKVTIAGLGTNRINRAYTTGAQQLIDTIHENFDIPIHHYVEVDFAGFRQIVDSIGGVRMYVPTPARDAKTGLDIKKGGCQTLEGRQALAWMRSRNYSSYVQGEWRSDQTADFGRIARQQALIRALMQQAIRKGIRDPRRANRLADSTLDNLKIDSELRLSDVLELARTLRSADPSVIEMVRLPTTSANVVEVTEEAEPLLARLRGELPQVTTTVGQTPTAAAPSASSAVVATTTTTAREIGPC